MATSRYSASPILGLGSQYGTSMTTSRIRAAIKNNSLAYREVILRGAERLDTVAGEEYGDGRYWWVIAASSDIGWGLQVPAGTLLRIPELAAALALCG